MTTNEQASIFYSKKPFTREISVKDCFNLPQYEDAVNSLYSSVEDRNITTLISPAGGGKTVVLRSLKERLSVARYQVGYIKVTDLSQRDMCREIAHTIGAKPSSLFYSLVRNIQDCFSESYKDRGIKPVLLIDEAQDMRAETMSILKLLTNFDMDSKLIVSIVLSGQPKLKEVIKREDLIDIAQRIFHHVELRLLTKDEMLAYMRHRCHVSNLSPFPFDEAAVSVIFEISRGNMRVVDYLALKSIEIAMGKKLGSIGQELVLEAKKSLWT